MGVTAVTFAGQMIFGFSLSLTVMVCRQVAMLPDASVAFQVIVVIPLG